jgi:hypothetical protein
MPRANEDKKSNINLKVSPITHAEFSLACDLREVTMSKVLHSHILRIINEEKGKNPEAFAQIQTVKAVSDLASTKPKKAA